MTPTTQNPNPGAGGSYLRLPDGTLERRSESAPTAADPAAPTTDAPVTPARKD